MTAPFRKVPTFALEAVPDLSHRELRVYLACISLADLNQPRQATAHVSDIAEAAGLQRSHANSALRSLAEASGGRPALITYTPATSRYSQAVITIVESPAMCTDSGHVEPPMCTATGQVTVHMPVHMQASDQAKAHPLEPENHREDINTAFETWWNAYPKKRDKGRARTAYAKAMKGTDPATLLAALDRYKASPEVTRGYVKHPATWLNAEAWLNEYETVETPEPSAIGDGYRWI